MATPTTPKSRSKTTKPAGGTTAVTTTSAPAESPASGATVEKAPAAATPRKPRAANATTAKATTAKKNAAQKPAARTAPKATTRKPTASKAATAKASTAPLEAIGTRTAWSIGAVLVAAGAGLVAFLTRGRINRLLAETPSEGHVPTDLLDPDRNADDRAIADFRPNIDAPMTDAEREALRPAPGTAAKLVASR